MRKGLLNHRFLSVKLRQLLVLSAFLLVPLGAMGLDLIIAGTPVTETGVVTGENISGTVSFDVDNKTGNKTLTLDGATINGGIELKSYGPLTVKIKGVCSVIGNSTTPAFKTEYACSLNIARLNGTDAATLKYVGDIDNFTAEPTSDVFSYFSNTVNGTTYNYYTTETIYNLAVAGIIVHNIEGEPGYKGDIFQDGETPTATFDGTNMLTLNSATLTSGNTIGIFWGADEAFTIELQGSNSITTTGTSCIISKYSKNISFTQGDASNPCSLELSTGTTAPEAVNVISGFANSGSPTMGTGLSWIIEESSGSDVTKAAVAEDYKMVVGGKKVHSGNASDVLGDGKVIYNAKSNTLTLNGATITGAIWMDTGTEDLTVALNGTCSVTNTSGTYALYTNGGKFNFIKASGATNAELTATCGNGYNPISFYSSSLGDGLYWALTSPVTTTSILITDDESKVLPTPTIAFDADKVYLTTDKIAVTRNTNDATSTDIFYTWGDAVIGTVYKHNADNPTLTKYDGTNQVSAETGTLRAWVGYQYGSENYYVLSKAASQAFTALTNIDKCAIGDLTATESYTGSKIEPTFTVTDGAKTLNKGTDYTVAYYTVVNGDQGDTPVDMIEVGEYRIVISGKGNYGGIKTQDFEITKANLENAIITVPDETYTGNALEPAVTVKLTAGGTSLVQGDDYSVAYSNNTNAAKADDNVAPTVTITGKGNNCTGSKSVTFTIKPKSIEGVTVTLGGEGFDTEKNCFVYNGQNQKPTVTVKDGEKLLVLDTDYTLENNGGVGAEDNYDVTVRGKGNYDENTSFVVTYGIAPRSIAETNVNLDATATYVYTGWEQKPEPVVKYGDTQLVKDEDYTLSYSNNINAAAEDSGDNAPTITITGMGNFDENTTTTVKFTINKADLAGAAISKISFGGKDYTVGDADIEIEYTGEAIHPTVEEVTYNDGTVTLDASEYTVSWGEHNTELSNESESAQVIITATGKNFTAGNSTSLNFKIVAANVKITAPNQTETYNGSPQAYTSATVNNENATLAIAYYAREEDRSKGSNALAEAPTNADTYYVRVTQTNSNYTAEPADATFTIDQLSIADAVITLDKTELTYNETEQTVNVTKVMVGTVEVPATSYEVSDNVQTLAGEHTVTVTAKPNEGTFKNNFKGFATTTFTIKDRTAEISFGSGLTYMTYYHADENFLIPDGVSAYIITGVEGNTLTIKKVSYLKAGVPLLLAKTAGSTSTKDPEEDFTVNLLKYASSDVNTTGNEFVLYKNEFVKATGTISQKCYLNLASVDPAHTRSFSIGDGTTGMVNGQWSMVNDQWYDLQGRKIQKPTKAGLYIQNGKVIMINNK